MEQSIQRKVNEGYGTMLFYFSACYLFKDYLVMATNSIVFVFVGVCQISVIFPAMP